LRSSSTTDLKPGSANKQDRDVQPASLTAQGPGTPPAAPVTVGSPPATIGNTLRASCGPDVQRLCVGARRESEALQCLDSQRMELSTTCSLYFRKLGTRPTAQKNAQNKKPPSSQPTRPIPTEVNAPNKQPQPPSPTTPTATEENGTSKPPPTPTIKTIPFPD
jgi:hypothetical protein